MKTLYILISIYILSIACVAQTSAITLLTSSNFDKKTKFSQTSSDSVMEEWIARYNWSEDTIDIATALAIDDSGNVYVTGYSQIIDPYQTNNDYATVKYNSSGQEQWVSRYGSPAHVDDKAYAIAVDDSGNVYITGVGLGLSSFDYNTIKYNSLGIQQWIAHYDGPGHTEDIAKAISLDDSGNVYVTGASYSSSSVDFATIKYNPSGNELWVNRYNGPGNGNDYSVAIVTDINSNIYVTGWSKGNNNSDNDYTTIKYNSSGTQEWLARYNGPSNYFPDFATAIAIDDSENVFVTGYSYGGTNSDYDFVTVKYNKLGIQEWATRYNGPGNNYDQATAIALDTSGNVYVTGRCYTTSSNYDYTTIKYSPSGNEEWVERYDGPGNSFDEPSGLAVDLAGNVYVTGKSIDSNGRYNYFTIKYNTLGEIIWSIEYKGPNGAGGVPRGIKLDKNGCVYITGSGSGYGTSNDYITIKYKQELISKVEPNFNNLFRFTLNQNYPNPFNPSTSIQYAISSTQFVTLKVYDLLGREVAILVNEEKAAGSYEIEFNVGRDSSPALASGIYFYKLQAGDFIETKKMILLK